MERYKWHLDRTSHKAICPKCGQKRFVLYVDDSGTPAGEEYGRCDREQSCGYSRYPGKEVSSNNTLTHTPAPKITTPMRYDSRVLSEFNRIDSNLFPFFASLVTPLRAMEKWQLYNVGCYNDNVIFWQRDINGEIRGGKLIRYDKNGHRVKDDKPASWTHYQKVFNPYKTGDKLEQCLFGEWLLAKYPDAPVVVVESEKTALIMSAIAHSNHIWLASGGSQMLKDSSRTKVLEGRDVLLMPDQGQYWNWHMVAQRLHCQIDNRCESFNQGDDILDFVLAHKEELKR